MTCDEYQEQASQYIDGEMKDEDASELFMHLGACVDCRSFLRGSLELRSKIHDDILKAEATVSAQPANPNDLDTSLRRRPFGPQGHPIRLALANNRLSLSFKAAIGFATLIVVATLVVSLAMRSGDTGNNPEQKVVYVMSLPTIEVQGVYPVKNQ